MKRNNLEEVLNRYMPVTESGCWIYLGTILSHGYGQIKFHGIRHLAHRFFYRNLIGEIPKSLTIDHLCRVRCCVNPNHMELVSVKENILRGFSKGAVRARFTHCIYGHAFDLQNTYRSKDGFRRCRICSARRTREYRERLKP